MKEYIFDIDDTICRRKSKKIKGYQKDNLIPNNKLIYYINKLYDNGFKITIITGRGMLTKMDWRSETEKQLLFWGVKYHKLKFVKKPIDYLYVDDKACSPKAFLNKVKKEEKRGLI